MPLSWSLWIGAVRRDRVCSVARALTSSVSSRTALLLIILGLCDAAYAQTPREAMQHTHAGAPAAKVPPQAVDQVVHPLPLPPETLAVAVRSATPCPTASSPALGDIRSRLNGRYGSGKADDITPLAFPMAPQPGSTLSQWLNTHNSALLETLNTKLTTTERSDFQTLETQTCGTQGLFCRIALRQQAIHYLIAAPQP